MWLPWRFAVPEGWREDSVTEPSYHHTFGRIVIKKTVKQKKFQNTKKFVWRSDQLRFLNLSFMASHSWGMKCLLPAKPMLFWGESFG